MARLKSHGRELARFEYPDCRVALMSDGNLMRNYGTGWKLYKKLKPGVDPVAYANERKARYNARPEVFHQYVATIKDATSIEHRWKLHEYVTLMPNDPDGVQGEFNDHTYGGDTVSIEECITLCRLYEQARSLKDSSENESV